MQESLGADTSGGGWLLLPRLWWALGADGRGWGSPVQQGSSGTPPVLHHAIISRADYTKSVIDLRPEDFVGEGGSLGDRSKSVPGLNTELVRPSACCRAGYQVEEPSTWLAVPCCPPRRQLVPLFAGGGGGGHR